MNLRKILACLSVATLIMSVGCDNGNATTESSSSSIDALETVEDPNMAELKTAIEGLRNREAPYLVSVGMMMPNEATYFIEVNDEKGSYTQYSTDEEGNIGKVAYELAENTQFMLFDWLVPNGKGYLINQSYVEGESSQWLELPNDYAERLSARKTLYMDILINGVSNIEKGEVIKTDFGAGEIDIQMYSCDITSDCIAEMLGIDTLGLYKSLKTKAQTKKDTKVEELMDDYIEELEMNLVFSDAKANFGIADGVLRYLDFEVGGLGSRMSVTRTVLEADSEILYDQPTFTDCNTYYSTVKELAEYVSEYDSYDEAITDLQDSEVIKEEAMSEAVAEETKVSESTTKSTVTKSN